MDSAVYRWLTPGIGKDSQKNYDSSDRPCYYVSPEAGSCNADELFKRLVSLVYRKRFIQIVNICLVVFIMMDLHRQCVNMGF